MKAVSNLTFPNFYRLRELTAERLAVSPLEEISNDEWSWIKSKIAQQMTLDMQHDPSMHERGTKGDDTAFPWAGSIVEDIAPHIAGPVCKWEVFQKWLSMDEGLCLQKPLLISGIVNQSLHTM